MIKQLIDTKCIQIGNFQLKNGSHSKYYFDMKNLISKPSLLRRIGDAIYELIKHEDFDLICGVPIGALPIATYISTKYDVPMIIPRIEEKEYGTRKQIEGKYSENSKCIIIEDVVTTGYSVGKIVDLLKTHMNVVGIFCVIDRMEVKNIEYPVHSLITKNDILRLRLNRIIEKKNCRLCFSGDIEDKKDLIQTLREVGQYIVICKIHYDIYDDDVDFVRELIQVSIEHDFMIMEDRKYVDISHIVKKQYRKVKNWVDFVTVMPTINEDVLKTLSGVFIVANMSNNVWDMTAESYYMAVSYRPHVVGFITQKRIQMEDMICMTPGINNSLKKIEEQNYREVCNIDTDIIIVGRGIYENEDRVERAIYYGSL